MRKYIGFVCLYYFLLGLPFFISNGSAHGFSVRFLDVGQGDSTLIMYQDLSILIDTGPPGGLDKHIYKYFFPVCDLDQIYITHPHLDHFGSLTELLKFCNPASLTFNDIDVSSKAYTVLLNKIENKYKNKKVVRAIFSGNKFIYNDLQIITLWPTQNFVSNVKPQDDLNQMSTVLFIDYKDFEVLLTGDAEDKVLSKIDYTPILSLIDNELDVLKVPHHGSAKGLSPKLLALLRPKYCVISVGKDNKYGHPTATALSLMKESACEIMRTDALGTIEFDAD